MPFRGSLELICYAAKAGIIDIEFWKGGLPMDNYMKLINHPHRKRRDIYPLFLSILPHQAAGELDPNRIKMKLFIGSLSYNVTEGDLRHALEAFGQVTSVSIVKDQESGRSKGFGFVEMPVQSDAQSAIAGLNGQAFSGRTITVNEARPHPDGRRGRDRGGRGDRRGRGRY